MAEWICVTQHLPDLHTPVLITDGEVCVVAEWHEFDYTYVQGERVTSQTPCWREVGFGGHEWEWDFSDKEITHWMPLPGLPQKEGTDG